MFEKVNKWVKDHEDTITLIIVLAGTAAVGGLIGGAMATNRANTNLANRERELNRVLSEAKNTLNNINSKVDSVVRNVYNQDAKRIFEQRLNDTITNERIVNYAKDAVKSGVTDILAKTAEKAVDKYDIAEVMKEYIDDNSAYFNRKIVKVINEIFDDDFADAVAEAVKDSL